MSKPAFAFSKPLAGRLLDIEPCAVLAYVEGSSQGDAMDYLLIVDVNGRMVWVRMSEVVIRDPETVFVA